MEITWLGHASFMIKTKDIVIHIDPYAGEPAEKADIILVSHDHYDHFSREKITKIMTDDTAILSSRKASSEMDGIVALNAGDTRQLDNISIKAVAAYNTSKPFHPKGAGIGFVIEAEGKKVYFAGDTDLIPEMKQIKADVVILPVGGTYTMNAEEAAKAVEIINPKIAIPMHYGSVAGTIDDAEAFKEEVEAKTDSKVMILKEGKSVKV